MGITINKTELTEDEKRKLVSILDDERDAALKEKIEKSELLSRQIKEKEDRLQALTTEEKVIQANHDEVVRRCTVEETRLRDLSGHIETAQRTLTDLQTEITSTTYRHEADQQRFVLEKEQITADIRNLGATFARLIEQGKNELSDIVVKVAKKASEMEKLQALEKHTKGYFIRLIEKKLAAKGTKVDVLKLISE